MNQKFVETPASRSGERGGARLKFIVVILIVGVLGYAGYMYIPVQFDSYRYKDLMQHNVDVAATQGYPVTWVSNQLIKSGPEYNVPTNAVITPTQEDNRVIVRVQFTRPIEFPGYTYQYEFDHTAKSVAFLTIK